MREVTFEESRKIQLDILRDIDRTCRENGIKYSLSMGTLIGAIRHKGFIPWDDDIDLMMTRDEYVRFNSIYKGKYKLINLDTNKDWWDCYTRIADSNTICVFTNSCYKVNHGIWVTIIPIDNVPDDNKEWINRRKKIIRIYKMCKLKCRAWNKEISVVRNSLQYLLKGLLMPFPLSFLAKKAQRILNSSNDIQTKRKTRMLWGFRDLTFPSEVFNEYVDVPFEDVMAMVIADYDTFMTIMYGDYMKLPPSEKQIAKHNYKAYRLD